MSSPALNAATAIIALADRANSADVLLRRTLSGDWTPPDRRWIARAVFSFFRWRGWLEPDCLARESPASADPSEVQITPRQLEDKVCEAISLQDQFNLNPRRYPSSELARRCLPGWLSRFLSPPEEWLRVLQSEPTLWIRAKRGAAEELAFKLGSCRPAGTDLWSHSLAYQGTEDLYCSPAFHAGEFEIQDIASQMVSLLVSPQPGEKWWDVCAGEGGKTLHLADLMQNRGLIIATDRAEWRLRKLKRRAARARMFNYRAKLWDGAEKLPTRITFDGVLLDAPCSGIGTWQRNPHARWTTFPQDIEELRRKQLALLIHASAAVKSGGKLAYAVCTLTGPETSDIRNSFDERPSGFIPLSLDLPHGGFPSQGAEHLWWPQQTGGNGMYVALWKRNQG